MKIFIFQLVSLLTLSPAYAQLVEYPIGSYGNYPAKNKATSRTQAVTLNLPFWDDFSTSDSSINKNLWISGDSVFVNNGIGIHPPSKNVATFDGVDHKGKPYSVNDVLAKGFADQLISQRIRLDLVDPALRPTVFISFFYQVKGRGESPDPGDQLVLSYLNADKKWEVIYSIENSASLLPDRFYQAVIPIADARFYHQDFQFRFHNFARLSGPYDTWNLDYIYVNVNRNADDTSYTDRTISTSLTSLFDEYYSMPAKHFLQNPAGNLKKPSIELYNLKKTSVTPGDGDQPFSYSSEAVVTTKKGQTTTSVKIILDQAQKPDDDSPIKSLTFYNLTLNKTLPVSAFQANADSIGIKFKFSVNTKDNVLPGPLNGDYDPVKYSPIDFRLNDTTLMKSILSNYYAYDDGVAEYGAGLNQAGSYVAFKYHFKGTKPDTLVSVDIYFPEFGDNTSQSILLQVRKDLSDTPSSILYQGQVTVNRSTKNIFKTYTLDPAVVISGDFYVGWKQVSNASIPFGLDKNTDSADKIYYNTTGTWIQNTTVIGSMMVRPGFGSGKPEIITGVENEVHIPIYPNPTTRICYLPADAEFIYAVDVTGRRIETELQNLTDRKSMTFISSISGLVIVRYNLKGKLYTEKIMVRGQ